MTLLCGLALAIVVAILEFCWNTKKNASQGRQSLCSEMGQVNIESNFFMSYDFGYTYLIPIFYVEICMILENIFQIDP